MAWRGEDGIHGRWAWDTAGRRGLASCVEAGRGALRGAAWRGVEWRGDVPRRGDVLGLSGSVVHTIAAAAAAAVAAAPCPACSKFNTHLSNETAEDLL